MIRVREEYLLLFTLAFQMAVYHLMLSLHEVTGGDSGIFGVPNLEARELFRGVFDGRHKLVRYFGMGDYNLPADVQQLLTDNDVALYDLQSDPDEMDNLADPAHPRYDEALLSAMNQKLNALIEEEIGEDNAMFTPPETVTQK